MILKFQKYPPNQKASNLNNLRDLIHVRSQQNRRIEIINLMEIKAKFSTQYKNQGKTKRGFSVEL